MRVCFETVLARYTKKPLRKLKSEMLSVKMQNSGPQTPSILCKAGKLIWPKFAFGTGPPYLPVLNLMNNEITRNVPVLFSMQ